MKSFSAEAIVVVIAQRKVEGRLGDIPRKMKNVRHIRLLLAIFIALSIERIAEEKTKVHSLEIEASHCFAKDLETLAMSTHLRPGEVIVVINIRILCVCHESEAEQRLWL